MTGYLAYSKAGHDRHKIYLIIREQGEYVYLADGKTKMPDHPKRKKKKHIQIINARITDMKELQNAEFPYKNEEINKMCMLHMKFFAINL